MINTRRLLGMARKWQMIAAMGRRRITGDVPRTDGAPDSSVQRDKMLASKGHFVFYTTDGKRFEVPLKYLSNPIFEELFRISEEEYGLQGNSPLRLLCNSVFMKGILRLLKQRLLSKVQEAAVVSSCRQYSTLHLQGYSHQQILVQGF